LAVEVGVAKKSTVKLLKLGERRKTGREVGERSFFPKVEAVAGRKSRADAESDDNDNDLNNNTLCWRSFG